MVETFYSALHWAKKAEKSARLASELSQSTGKVIQLGFDGSFENGELVFKHAPGGVELPYDLYDDTEYEIDLAFSQTGELSNLTKMYIKNGNDKIVFVSAQHRSSTENARVADMEDVMRYNESTGYRWLFKATYKITPSGDKVFLIYPVIAKKDTSTITNCITEIPQDIKLELADGVVILKAGSRVYIPNGFEADGVTPKFDIVVTTSDVAYSWDSTDTNNLSLYYRQDGGGLIAYATDTDISGGETPSIGNFYNVNTNTIYRINKGQVLSYQLSLPLAHITSGSNMITSIDQIFNGFGYIGSTVFALPNVKGLIPDGRNADGSLKNTEYVTNKVATQTLGSDTNGSFSLNVWSNGEVAGTTAKYDANLNKIIGSSRGSNCFEAGGFYAANGKITSLSPKTTFHAVDRNDSSWVSAQAMPSNKYIDLTLGASGASYTAPANGWFTHQRTAGTANTGMRFSNVTVGSLGSACLSSTTAGTCAVTVPAKKGDEVFLYYNTTGTGLNIFRFIYAEGEI